MEVDKENARSTRASTRKSTKRNKRAPLRRTSSEESASSVANDAVDTTADTTPFDDVSGDDATRAQLKAAVKRPYRSPAFRTAPCAGANSGDKVSAAPRTAGPRRGRR